MAQFGEAIDIDEAVKGYKAGFEVLPPSWYTVVVTGSSIVDTSTGGKMVVLEYTVQGGNGGELKDRHNIINKSKTAQDIGLATLGKIAKCCGVKGKLNDTDLLHGRPFDVKVIIKPFKSNKIDEATGEYPMIPANEVTDYKAKGEGASVVPETSSEDKEVTSW